MQLTAGTIRWRILCVVGFVAAAVTLVSAPVDPFGVRSKARFADEALVAFVRPGLVIKVGSASIAADGTIRVEYAVTDPKGAPLDYDGIATPGAISLSYVAAFIPQDKAQYTSYTVRSASGAVVPSTMQAGADSGGRREKIADGQYRYTFGTKAPSGYDAAATHTIGIYGSRDLNEFELGTNYASTTFNFVPGGGAVTKVRDVVRTQSCNRCHDQLAFHGGSRRGVELCVLCHTPQTVDPDTGNTVDLKVMAHKIHLGEDLPSVQAGKPYQIIGFNGAVADYSTVVNPADSRRCEVCHDPASGATQAANYLTKPTMVTCGSCHDNVNFQTGENHAGGPQVSDNLCANCHIPQGELDFDASIKGAHTVEVDSTMLSGLVAEIVSVTDGQAGKAPTVAFTLKDNQGHAVALNQLNNLSLIMAGPSSDYGNTNFGSDVTTKGYVSESATTTASCSGVNCTYKFVHAIPANAKGTFAIGLEGRRTEVLLDGTLQERSVRYGLKNQVIYFPVDGSAVEARRGVVQVASCNQCHFLLSKHGDNRNQTEFCVFCHNPSNSNDTEGINLNLLVHRIHNERVRYPAMSPSGSPGDTRSCMMCHVNGSEQQLPVGKNAVVDPQGWINPAGAVTSACTSCHSSKDTASHALANTTSLGESCTVCHGPDANFSVAKSHAQY